MVYNKEIRVGLCESLLPHYLEGIYAQNGETTVAKMFKFIRRHAADKTEELPPALRPLRPAHHEGGHQLRCRYGQHHRLGNWGIKKQLYTSGG